MNEQGIPEWANLPIAIHRDEDMAGATVRFSAVQMRKYYATATFSRQLLEDSAINIDRLISTIMDRAMRPWLYPKVTPFPVFVVWPTWDRVARLCRPVRSWFQR